METDVLLSIIIPFYNGSRYINELIDSLLLIAIEKMEIIIVDDGSKVEESELLKEIMVKDARIIYQRQENMGIVGARNTGLSQAKGEYLLFCDQDDKVNYSTVKRIIYQMIEQKADIGFYSTKHFNDKGKEWECDSVYKEGTFREKQVADIFLRKLITRYARGQEVISYVGHLWGAIIASRIVKDHSIRFKRYMSIEDDLLFVLDVLDYSKCVVTTTQTGYYWRSNPVSATKVNKYISKIDEKMKEYYKYRTSILVKHNVCNVEEMNKYINGMWQEYALNFLFNESTLDFFGLMKRLRYICDVLSEPEVSGAINSSNCCPFAFNNYKIMILLQKKWLKLAIVYTYYIVIKRKFRYYIRIFINNI